MIFLLYILFIVTAPAAVFACEGECIVGITNEFISRYSNPVSTVLENIANQICTDLFPNRDSAAAPCVTYLQPLVQAYNSSFYKPLEHAIFPSYFHGKCQNAQGVDPEGCPNPDCPVVCGTPGSLVHFYPKLQSIVFKSVRDFLLNNTTPNSQTYKGIERSIAADHSSSTRRAYPPNIRPRTTNIQKSLRKIFNAIPVMLGETCGGPSMSNCSWEEPMKKFILSYP